MLLINLLTSLCFLYDENVPIVKGTSRNRREIPCMPWITNAMLRSINKKNKFYYKYKIKKSDILYKNTLIIEIL